MPIDFMAIAAQFEVQTQRLIKPLALAFEHLGKWLKPRAKQFADIEQATRAFPVLRFYEEALTAVLDPSQRGTLSPIEPSQSLLGSVGEGARRFVGGLERIPQAVREEFLIPNFLGSINDILVAIVASIDRYSRPTAALFDPKQPRHFLDIIGQSVLLFRATGTSLRQIDRFTASVQALRQVDLIPSNGSPKALPDRRSALEQVDDIGRTLTLAILSLPMFGAVLQTLIDSVILKVQSQVLNHFQHIEQRVFNLRQTVLKFFAVDLLNFSEKAIRFTIALSFIIRDNLRVYTAFGVQYAEQSIQAIAKFLGDFSTWMNEVMRLISGWLTGMFSFLDVEIIDVAKLLGMPSITLGTTLMKLPTIRLRDLLVDNAEAIGAGLIAAIESIRNLPGGRIADAVVGHRIAALENVIAILTNDRLRRRFLSELSPDGAFQTPTVNFPNPFEAFFGAGSSPFRDTLRTTRESLERNIGSILEAGSQTLNTLGTRFATVADRAAQLDPTRAQALAQTADRLANQLFGNQGGTPHPPDRLAMAFDQALARGGFELFNQVIPIYVLEMERYWQEQRTSEVQVTTQTPTSPHILARRQRLGRVEAPELVIRLPDRPLNSDLVQAAATQFRQALNGIYRTGLERHQSAAATP